MSQIYDIYNQFLNIFPSNLHLVISIILVILIVYSVFQTVKRNFIWIILLIILLPASLPILSTIWKGVLELLKFLLTKR